MERCKQAEAVLDRRGEAVLVETPSGDLAPAYTFNAMGVFKGAELLGKHLGMFNEKDNGLNGAEAIAESLREVADNLNG